MKKVAALTLAGVCALVLSIPAAGAATSKAAPSKTVAAKSARTKSALAPETVSGRIAMIDPSQKVVVVKGADGTPFDMVVTSKTHILNGKKSVPFHDLGQYQNQGATIKFIPERRGDVAESIQIGG